MPPNFVNVFSCIYFFWVLSVLKISNVFIVVYQYEIIFSKKKYC